MGVQKYAEAKLIDLLRVVEAAETLYAAMAEFPDDTEAWKHDATYFDIALESCPGTNAYYHKIWSRTS